MGKLLLMSTFLSMIILPIRAARIEHPGRGMRRALLSLLLFNLFYVAAVVYIHFHLIHGPRPAHLLGEARM